MDSIASTSSTKSKRNRVLAKGGASNCFSVSGPVQTPKIGLAGQVVLRLCEDVIPNTLICFDKCFCSFQLLKELAGRHIWAVCTMRENITFHCPLIPKKQIKKQKSWIL